MAIALTLGAELIFLILLLGLAPKLIEKVETPSQPLSFDLAPPTPEAKKAPRPKPKAQATKSAAAPAKRPPITPPRLPLVKSPLVEMSKVDFAATDISKLGSRGESGDSASAMGPGEGPGGAHLYKAEWVVEPTHAELAYYLPNGAEDGSSAEIACKTIPNYRVENCVLLSESPMGTGLAKAMRLAAWQFKVRPPRIDGKPLVGAWVRIHFDFGKEGI
jgi:protein TonB